MKKFFFSLLFIGTLFTASNAQQSGKKLYPINCSTLKCLNENKNKDVSVQGVFRKYTPGHPGKGNTMFWDWEIVLSDNSTVPVKSTYDEINYSYFEGKKVLIKGTNFFGTIIKGEAEECVGFRIDPVEIAELKK